MLQGLDLIEVLQSVLDRLQSLLVLPVLHIP